MSELKREVWVIESDDRIVHVKLSREAADREALSASGERVVRYVPDSSITLLAGEAAVPPLKQLWRCKRLKVPGDGGIVDGCGWQGPTDALDAGGCPDCGSNQVRRVATPQCPISGGHWLDGSPDTAGQYWVCMWLLVPGRWEVRLVNVSPAVLVPNGRLLLKFSDGAAFAYEPNRYAIACYMRHGDPPAPPFDLSKRPPPPAKEGV